MTRVLIMARAATLVISLWATLGEAEATPALLGGLHVPGVPVLAVGHRKRHRSHYSHSCDEIRELQRMWPETRWPPSMRCHPYREHYH